MRFYHILPSLPPSPSLSLLCYYHDVLYYEGKTLTRTSTMLFRLSATKTVSYLNRPLLCKVASLNFVARITEDERIQAVAISLSFQLLQAAFIPWLRVPFCLQSAKNWLCLPLLPSCWCSLSFLTLSLCGYTEPTQIVHDNLAIWKPFISSCL